MKHRKLIPLIGILAISFLAFPAAAEEQAAEAQKFKKTAQFAQELTLILPAFNKTDEIFSPGFGGSLVYETYALGRLFSSLTLPGLVLGVTGSMLIYLPTMENPESIYNSALFLAGGYLGFQFYVPLSPTLSFAPALYGGGKYYFSFHPDRIPSYAANPVICAGLNLNICLEQRLSLSPVVEYQLYYDGRGRAPGHTLQFSLRTGILF